MTTEKGTTMTAEELNRSIPHPVWCARDCCIEFADMGDVWHESRTQSKYFDSDPVRRDQRFTAYSKMVRYGVVGEEDTPAGAEVLLKSEEMVEEVRLFLSPDVLRSLALWLVERADEVDAMTGVSGLD